MEWFLKHMFALMSHWFVGKMIKKYVEAEIAMFDLKVREFIEKTLRICLIK